MLTKKILKRLFAIAFLFYIAMFIKGCQCNSDRPDISGIKLDVKAERFEKDLFSLDTVQPASGLTQLRNKYGNFFDLFAFRITSLGSRDSMLMADNFRNFVSDSNFRAIYNDCEKVFDGFQPEEKELTKAFKYYSVYFPDKNIPQVVTIISGFSYPVVCDSARLGLSLDMYLGPDYRFYSTLEPPLPVYLRTRMRKEYIVADAMKGWAQSDYAIDETSARMVDFMISDGRLMYFLDKVMPECPDTIKSGYSKKQLDWCLTNEKSIWSFFVENKLLFSIDPNLMNKYVNDGPTTNGFPKESPGNIGRFIGWQIVRSYMKNHPEASLKKLMEEKDLGKLFNESKYKPIK